MFDLGLNLETTTFNFKLKVHFFLKSLQIVYENIRPCFMFNAHQISLDSIFVF